MMKKILICTCFLAIVFGCEDNYEHPRKKGKILFSLSKKESAEGRIASTSEPHAVRISILNGQGETVEQQRILQLISFGSGYVTESLELQPDNYAVTEFLVLNESEEVIYATPLEGSARAGDVSDPLPVAFVVSEDATTDVNLQVVPVTETTDPEDFGYANFRFDIIDTPPAVNGLTFRFTSSLNPEYVTEGLDSVVITFSKRTETKVFSRKLTVISPVEAVGTITYEALDLGFTPFWPDWQITARAYYEIIDEVDYNHHINEQVSELATIPIRHETTLIEVDDNSFSLQDANGVYASYGAAHIVRKNFAHLMDETFAFHFIVSNDLCEPAFDYTLQRHTDWMYCEKYVFDESGFDDYRVLTREPAEAGHYRDETTFAGMCPAEETGSLTGFVFFQMVESVTEGTSKDCFLVWEKPQTPVDPEISGTQKSQGAFKVYSKDEYEAQLDKSNRGS